MDTNPFSVLSICNMTVGNHHNDMTIVMLLNTFTFQVIYTPSTFRNCPVLIPSHVLFKENTIFFIQIQDIQMNDPHSSTREVQEYNIVNLDQQIEKFCTYQLRALIVHSPAWLSSHPNQSLKEQLSQSSLSCLPYKSDQNEHPMLNYQRQYV